MKSHLNREEYEALNDPAARARRDSLPKSTDRLTYAQREAAFQETQLRQSPDVGSAADEKRAAEEKKAYALEQSARIDVIESAIKRAPGAQPRAGQLAHQKIADIEKRIRIAYLGREEIVGVAKFLDEVEAGLQATVDEISRIAIAEAEETARTREAQAEAEAQRGAAGMSAEQAVKWFEARGFRLRLKGGDVQIAPSGALDRNSKAMLRLHRPGLIRLLQVQGDFTSVE